MGWHTVGARALAMAVRIYCFVALVASCFMLLTLCLLFHLLQFHHVVHFIILAIICTTCVDYGIKPQNPSGLVSCPYFAHYSEKRSLPLGWSRASVATWKG